MVLEYDSRVWNHHQIEIFAIPKEPNHGSENLSIEYIMDIEFKWKKLERSAIIEIYMAFVGID